MRPALIGFRFLLDGRDPRLGLPLAQILAQRGGEAFGAVGVLLSHAIHLITRVRPAKAG